MKNTTLQILLFCLSGFLLKGQEVTRHADYKDQQLLLFIEDLITQGIDSIIIYSIDGEGLTTLKDYNPDFSASLPTYVFWKKNNQISLKRFDAFYPYQPILLEKDTIMTYAFKNFDAISKENTLNFSKKPANNTTFQLTDHFSFCDVTLMTKTRSFSYQIEDYLTDDKFFEPGITGLHQFKLHTIIEQAIRSKDPKGFVKESY